MPGEPSEYSPGKALEPVGGTDPQLGDALARWTAAEDPDARKEAARAALLVAAKGARAAGVKAVAGGRWAAETLTDVVPRIPVRSYATLRAHFPGKDVEAIAEELVTSAVNAATVVGAVAGAVAAVQWTAPPTLLTSPAQLAAATLVTSAVEVKLVAELHELYGVRAEGSTRDRALAYLSAWAGRRGIDPKNPASFRRSGLSKTLTTQVRRRLAGRLGRNVSTLGPMLSGAAMGGAVNRHETRHLAEMIREDLRLASGRTSKRSSGRS